MDHAQIELAMQKVLHHLEGEYTTLQVGRASTGLVDTLDVYVHSYGMTQKLHQLANVSIMDSQTLRIEAWDKAINSAIEKAIYDADIGLTPQGMGTHILIKIPPLTEDRRRDISKRADKLGEESKVAIRNIRQDARNILKKAHDAKEITEDDKVAQEATIEELTKKYTAQIDRDVDAKVADIMKV